MHDLHLADRIIKICQEKAQGKEVKQVKIKLGSIIEHEEEIKPENLEFNLKMLSKNSNLKNADFVIEKKQGNDFEVEFIEID